MSDEFDDLPDLTASGATPGLAPRGSGTIGRHRPRLVARLFVAADMPLRARLLAILMKPMGALCIAGVAAGAFTWVLRRGGAVADASLDLEQVGRVSSEQVLELARFVEQVNPQALLDFAALVEASHLGLATFSASALLLLYRALQSGPARPLAKAIAADDRAGR
jgi:hypothetical protein